MIADARGLRRRLGDGWQPARPWRSVAPHVVSLSSLVPTQWPHYSPCQLAQLRLGRPVEGGDPFPHVVAWRDELYVWDGHTRVARWLRQHLRHALVRVQEVDR